MNDLLASVVRLAAMEGAAGFEPATPACKQSGLQRRPDLGKPR